MIEDEWERQRAEEKRRLEKQRQERERRRQEEAHRRKKAQQAIEQQEKDKDKPPPVELPDTKDPKELAKAAVPSAIKALIEVAIDPTQSANARVSAANSIIDRGYGRVEQSVTAKIESKLDPDDIHEIAKRMRFLMAMAQSRGIESKPIEVVPERDDA